FFFFFFQAEDGIRDFHVTGVQTCALPICALAGWIWSKLPENPDMALQKIDAQYKRNQDSRDLPSAAELQKKLLPNPIELTNYERSEERRVGKECRSGWSTYQ